MAIPPFVCGFFDKVYPSGETLCTKYREEGKMRREACERNVWNRLGLSALCETELRKQERTDTVRKSPLACCEIRSPESLTAGEISLK